MSRRPWGHASSPLSKALRAAAKGGASLEQLVAQSGGLTPAEVIYRVFPPPRPAQGLGRTYDRKVNVMFDAETHDLLMNAAFLARVSPADLIRTFVEWGLEQQ